MTKTSGTFQRLAIATPFGKLFAAVSNAVACVDVSAVEAIDAAADKETRGQLAALDAASTSRAQLPSTPTHLAVSCDGLTLAVGLAVNDLPHIYFYDVRAFVAGAANVAPFQEARSGVVTGPGSRVAEFAWNPVLASMLAVVFSNGSAALYMVDAADGAKAPDCCTIPAAAGVTCVSWSPKGKQLVAGKADGTLTQYKPDLKEAKSIPAPPGAGHSVLSILWISTYQFLTAVRNNADPDSRPGLILVQSSKAGETSYINYDDVNYRERDAKS